MENITSKGTIFGTLIAQAGPKGDTGRTGDRGLTGEAGYSPIKGVDYFTQEDISEIRKGIEGDLTGEYNKNAIEKTNIFNTNAKETTTSFDLNAENKTKEYNDNALAEIEKYNSNAIEKSNNFDTNFENKTSKFDSNYDEKIKGFNDNNDLVIQNYNNNAKKQMEIFDTNFTEKLESFNNNAGTKFNGFNTNSDKALAEYNKNHTAKMKEFDDNYDTKTKTFDDNAAAKLDEYNNNDKTKTDAYNKNTELKEKSFNDNAGTKTETFNSNAADKQNEFDENASDKLAEYNQNTEELINKVEQVQAENEVLKAENKLIKEQIPSANASGNSIHIEDSSNLDFDWKIRSGHKQKTREGYNKIGLKDAKGSINGLEYEVKDGVITLNGTLNNSISNYSITTVDLDNALDFNADSYKMKWYAEGKLPKEKGNTVGIGAYYHNFIDFTSGNTVTHNITINGDDSIKINIVNGEGVTFNNVKIKLMIVEGTEDKPYEQYGVSPSPGYPSEVETVGSNINLLNNTLQSQTKNGLKVTVNKDKSVTVVGTATANTNIVFDVHNKTIEAGTYTLKDCRTFIESTENQGWWSDGETRAFTNTATLTNSGFFMFYKSGTVVNETLYPKLEKGSIATPYSPFGMGSVEIDVVNKNFINKNKISKGLMITATGETTNSKYFSTDYIKVSKNETYYANEYVPVVAAYDKDKKSIGYIRNTLTGGSFNTGNAVYIRARNNVQLSTEEEIQNAIDKAMIIKGSTSSDYIEHQSQTAIMPVQQEMLEGDYVADVEHHEWRKLLLTGEEDFTQNQNANKLNYFYVTYNSVKLEGKIISNMLKNVKVGTIWNKTFYDDIVSSSSNNKTINIMLSDTTITTLQQFKEKLKGLYDAGTPLILYFELATPVNLELTSEQKAIRDTKLYTYKNITNIDVSDELASIDITYKKDLDLEHEKLQNQIDEIRQLISTTETSALLLDNLQKDVEMEVE